MACTVASGTVFPRSISASTYFGKSKLSEASGLASPAGVGTAVFVSILVQCEHQTLVAAVAPTVRVAVGIPSVDQGDDRPEGKRHDRQSTAPAPHKRPAPPSHWS